MRDGKLGETTHPAEGEWRAYLDRELSLPRRRRLRRHVEACALCRERLEEVQATGERTTSLLRDLAPVTDVRESWERFDAVTSFLARGRASFARAFMAGGLSAAALVATVLLLHPAPTRLLGRVHGVSAFANVVDECCSVGDAVAREGVFTLEVPGVGSPLRVRYLDADGSGSFSSGDVVRSVTQMRGR